MEAALAGGGRAGADADRDEVSASWELVAPATPRSPGAAVAPAQGSGLAAGASGLSRPARATSPAGVPAASPADPGWAFLEADLRDLLQDLFFDSTVLHASFDGHSQATALVSEALGGSAPMDQCAAWARRLLACSSCRPREAPAGGAGPADQGRPCVHSLP